jgi:hypothetical protein
MNNYVSMDTPSIAGANSVDYLSKLDRVREWKIITYTYQTLFSWIIVEFSILILSVLIKFITVTPVYTRPDCQIKICIQ